MDNKLIARGLTHLIWRNGAVENYHMTEAPLTDEVMEVLNKDIYNRIYSLLCMDPEKVVQMATLTGMIYGCDWDSPEEVNVMDAE